MHFTFVTEFSPASLPAQAMRTLTAIFNEPDEPLFNIVSLYDWKSSSLNILNEVSRGTLDGAAVLTNHCQYVFDDGEDSVTRCVPGFASSATELVAKDSIVLLATVAAPAAGLWTKRAITGVQDLQGARVCAFDVESSALLRQLGAKPITIDWCHLTECVAATELDGVLCSGEGAASVFLSQNFRYFSAIRYPRPAFSLVISARTFMRLSKTLQEAVLHAGKSAEHQIKSISFYNELIFFENLVELGVIVDSKPSNKLTAAFLRDTASVT